MKKITKVHVLPYIDGTKYKNGKPKIKWVVKTNIELDKERRLLENEFALNQER